jgi:hypothetical protein
MKWYPVRLRRIVVSPGANQPRGGPCYYGNGGMDGVIEWPKSGGPKSADHL